MMTAGETPERTKPPTRPQEKESPKSAIQTPATTKASTRFGMNAMRRHTAPRRRKVSIWIPSPARIMITATATDRIPFDQSASDSSAKCTPGMLARMRPVPSIPTSEGSPRASRRSPPASATTTRTNIAKKGPPGRAAPPTIPARSSHPNRAMASHVTMGASGGMVAIGAVRRQGGPSPRLFASRLARDPRPHTEETWVRSTRKRAS